MSLGDVTFVAEDGSLGNFGSTGIGAHVKIGTPPVETTVPILITGSMKLEQMKEKLGLSPPAGVCTSSVENGVSRIYYVPVRPETAGTDGEVTHSGAGGGIISVSGTPNNTYDIILRITEDGPPNTAAFCYSVNGGHGCEAEETIPLSGKGELADIEIILTFAEEFKVGDTYRFSATTPVVSNSVVLKATGSLYNSDLDFGFIHVAGISARTLWVSLVASAKLSLPLYRRPVFFLYEVRSKGAEESLDEYTTVLRTEARGVDSYYVQVCSVWSQYTRWDDREQYISNVRIVAGSCGIAGVIQLIGRVDIFSISEAKMTRLMPGGTEDHISELDNAGYLTWHKYYGIDGCYVSSARVLCREGSDYRYVEYVRILNKMIREIYKRVVSMVQMDISAPDDIETDIDNILETLNIPLRGMVEAGELPSGSASIEDLEHVNILQDERLDLVILSVPKGYVREFRFSLAMENPYRNQEGLGSGQRKGIQLGGHHHQYPRVGGNRHYGDIL